MKKSIEPLIVKFLTNDANREELLRLETWIQEKDNKSLFLKYIKVNIAINKIMRKYDKEGAKKSFLLHIKQEKSLFQNKNKVYTLLKYAAAAIIVFGLGFFFRDNSFNQPAENDVTPVIVNTNNVEPGTDKATLTLEDGLTIVLEKGNSFQTLNANSDGEQIVYDAYKNKEQELVYNYLTIPRGGQFNIVLSDGTKVWLNSESQLKYPVRFLNGETRQVELVYGEAYFDVTPSLENKGSKFVVLNDAQEVEVLGTEFNIKAYKDETNIYTTLVEGKVAVAYNGKSQNLSPSLQSNLNTLSKTVSVAQVDVNNEISWMEGKFSFKGKPLKEIMKVISRWYDVEVVIKNKELEEVTFRGVFGKNRNLEEILTTLQTLSLIKKYEINGKIITLE